MLPNLNNEYEPNGKQDLPKKPDNANNEHMTKIVIAFVGGFAILEFFMICFLGLMTVCLSSKYINLINNQHDYKPTYCPMIEDVEEESTGGYIDWTGSKPYVIDESEIGDFYTDEERQEMFENSEEISPLEFLPYALAEANKKLDTEGIMGSRYEANEESDERDEMFENAGLPINYTELPDGSRVYDLSKNNVDVEENKNASDASNEEIDIDFSVEPATEAVEESVKTPAKEAKPFKTTTDTVSMTAHPKNGPVVTYETSKTPSNSSNIKTITAHAKDGSIVTYKTNENVSSKKSTTIKPAIDKTDVLYSNNTKTENNDLVMNDGVNLETNDLVLDGDTSATVSNLSDGTVIYYSNDGVSTIPIPEEFLNQIRNLNATTTRSIVY